MRRRFGFGLFSGLFVFVLSGVVALGGSSAASAPHHSTLGLGSMHGCMLGTKGAVRCFGPSNWPVTGSADRRYPNALFRTVIERGAVSVTAGRSVSCAILSSGAAECWGVELAVGLLGNGRTGGESFQPVLVSGLDGGSAASHRAIAIDAGLEHACAVTASGAARCWGTNNIGQFGNGIPTTSSSRWSSTPVAVSGLQSGVADISAGWYFNCAVTSAGAATCWGDNRYGMLGDGVNGANRSGSWVPVSVIGLSSGVRQVAAGGFHACALTSAGAVECWGSNLNGQLGDGSHVQTSSTPVPVVGLQSGVEQIAAGYSHTCALLNTGAVRCWGTGHSGELGNGKLVVAQNTPVAPRGLSGVVELGLGDRSSCARLKNGTVRCWGENGTRQLGLPRPSPSVVLYPTTVYGLDGCVVPNVVGQGSDAAVATLQQRDCSIANRYVHSRVRRYHVVSQKPRPGTHLPNGGKVHLTISLGR